MVRGELNELIDTGISIISIISDGAAPNLKDFDPSEMYETVQAISELPIIHIRCGAHACHIALMDFERDNEEFSLFLTKLKNLMIWLNQPNIKLDLKAINVNCKIPKIREIKGMSFMESIEFLKKYRGQIHEILIHHSYIDADWEENLLKNQYSRCLVLITV